ncbi:MAG: rubrerythrin family protein [Candidatus Sumerlaeia bacterium]
MAHAWVAVALLCMLAGQAGAQDKPAADGKAAKKEAVKVEVKSTLDNLQAAYAGESNASARYVAFAKKADAEGYGRVAGLFRAAARSESIHAANHAAAIKKLGAAPGVVGGKELVIDPGEIKSTRENLQAAIDGETYEFTAMYPAFLKKARADKDTAAVRTLNWARQVEADHAKLYQEALANLEGWKAPGQFYVCTVCGNTVAKVDFEKCPVCDKPKEKYTPAA